MWIDDEILLRHRDPLALSVWVPKQPLVVLGSSNKAESEVHLSACEQLNIPVLKRYGGGGTVVLYDGTVVISFGGWVRQQFQNGFYFDLLNRTVIACLAQKWPQLAALSQAGLSDIVFGQRKIAGTSLFRSRNYLLYQASILVELDMGLINQTLKSPTKEPSYREGRSHKEFLLGLSAIESSATVENVARQIEREFEASAKEIFGSEFVTPLEDQFANLENRAKLGKQGDSSQQ
jgi:lipoate-protein ligase A